jgi:hypothetical protein
MTRSGSILLLAIVLSASLVAFAAAAAAAIAAAQSQEADSQPRDLAAFAARTALAHAGWSIATTYANSRASGLATNLHQAWRNDFGPLDGGNLQLMPRGEGLSAADRDGRNTPVDRPLTAANSRSWLTPNQYVSDPTDHGYRMTTGFARHCEPGNHDAALGYGGWHQAPVAADVPRFDAAWRPTADPQQVRYRLRYAVTVEDLGGRLLVGFQEPDSRHSDLDPERGELARLDEFRARIFANLATCTSKDNSFTASNAKAMVAQISTLLLGRGGSNNGRGMPFHEFWSPTTTGLITPPAAPILGYPLFLEWPANLQDAGRPKARANGQRSGSDGWLHDCISPIASNAHLGGWMAEGQGTTMGALGPWVTGSSQAETIYFLAHACTPFGSWPQLPGAVGTRRYIPWTVNLLTASTQVVARIVGSAMDWKDLAKNNRVTAGTPPVTTSPQWEAFTNPYKPPAAVPAAGSHWPTSLNPTTDYPATTFPTTPTPAFRSGITNVLQMYKVARARDPLLGIAGSTLPALHPIAITGDYGDHAIGTPPADQTINPDSFWLATYAAAVNSIMLARWSWDPEPTKVDAAGKALCTTRPTAFPTIEAVDRHFCRHFGIDFSVNPSDGSTSAAMPGAAAVEYLVWSATPVNAWAKTANKAATGLTPVPLTSFADPDDRIAAERILNNLRMSLFGSASYRDNSGTWRWEYPDFKAIDFDGDGKAFSDFGQVLGSPPYDLAAAGRFGSVAASTDAARFSVSGNFTMRQLSRFYQVTVRGEVYDVLRNRAIASHVEEGVFACDPDGDGILNDTHYLYRHPRLEPPPPRDPRMSP